MVEVQRQEPAVAEVGTMEVGALQDRVGVEGGALEVRTGEDRVGEVGRALERRAVGVAAPKFAPVRFTSVTARPRGTCRSGSRRRGCCRRPRSRGGRGRASRCLRGSVAAEVAVGPDQTAADEAPARWDRGRGADDGLGVDAVDGVTTEAGAGRRDPVEVPARVRRAGEVDAREVDAPTSGSRAWCPGGRRWARWIDAANGSATCQPGGSEAGVPDTTPSATRDRRTARLVPSSTAPARRAPVRLLQ